MSNGFRTFSVLFLCLHNSARSILAEALLNRLGAGRFEAMSAGYAPAMMLSPHALGLLTRINYNTGRLMPKPMSSVLGERDPGFDFIFRLSPDLRGGPRPAQFKGKPVIIEWHLADPADTTGSPDRVAAAYADLFNVLAARLDALANLPVSALESPHIAARLERMGDEPLRLAS